MKHAIGIIATCISCLGLAGGCSFARNADRSLSEFVGQLDAKSNGENANAKQSSSELRVANPRAKTIRFGGSEILLGTTEAKLIAADQFWQQLSILMEAEKYFTAREFVSRSVDTAEQVLWEKWTSDPDGQQVRFIANILSDGVSPDASWTAMLNQVKTDPNSTNAYQIARTTFTKTLQTDSPSSDDVENLKAAAKQVGQPLAMIDALHLVALKEFAAGRYDDAGAYLLTAIEAAEQNENDSRAAELWLMLSINSARPVGQSVESASAWKSAIEKHCGAQSSTSRPLNVAFWQRAHEHQPANSSWPESTKQALLPLAKPIGCEFSTASPAGLFVWSAVGRAQLEYGEPQLALVNFKKAETFANGDDIMWLRIAQSECLSALGQNRAATTLLCGPLASKHPVIPLAASAALGSAKLQAGTFQQGAQLLATALNTTPEIDWPTKSEAEADLALAMLIIGETDRGLESLHAAQKTFESQGNISSLLQSLENEKRLMEHEGKTDRAAGIGQRIRQIEKSRAAAING